MVPEATAPDSTPRTALALPPTTFGVTVFACVCCCALQVEAQRKRAADAEAARNRAEVRLGQCLVCVLFPNQHPRYALARARAALCTAGG